MIPYVIDFETEAISGRPNDPPHPVGCAVWEPGREPYYLAWAHPEGNNTTPIRARAILQPILRQRTLLMHNAAFDLAVARRWFDVAIPSWERIHDTLFLLFLHDPYARSLSLKPSAARYLGEPPTEQDALHEHLVSRGVIRKNQKDWGAYISKGHADVVGPYAIGDVRRTMGLWQKLYPLPDTRMEAAYIRERKLLPILLRNEEEGVRVDLARLTEQEYKGTRVLKRIDARIRTRLRSRSLNVDSNEELAAALKRTGVVPEFRQTPTGKDSVSKKNLTPDMFMDVRVWEMLAYRNRLQTALTTFMRPWIEIARETGRIHTSWNQVRGDGGGGARTGRLSSSPNLQNIPKSWEGVTIPPRLPGLPLIRDFILPDEDGAFLHRDYSQQELRVLAHYEADILCEEYGREPSLDVHSYIRQQIFMLTGLELTRAQVKVLVFGIIYGMGLGKLAEGIQSDVDKARKVKWALRAAIPGLGALEDELRLRAKNDQPMFTWGGRRYYCEAPSVNDRGNIVQTYEYKMLNYLVQGSSADMTKEALIRYDQARKHGRFLVTVHDEINISAPKQYAEKEMKILKEVMESVQFDVPILTEGKKGPTWGKLEAA